MEKKVSLTNPSQWKFRFTTFKLLILVSSEEAAAKQKETKQRTKRGRSAEEDL